MKKLFHAQNKVSQEGYSYMMIPSAYSTPGSNVAWTLDEGATWDTEAVPNNHCRGGFARLVNGVMVISSHSTTNTVMVTDDYGATWTKFNWAGEASFLTVSETGQYIYIFSYNGNVHTSVNYGVSWTYNPGSINNASFSAMSHDGQYAVCVTGTSPGKIWYNHNYLNPSSWTDSGYTCNSVIWGYGYNPVHMWNNGKDIMLAYGGGTGYWYSTDYGVTWSTKKTSSYEIYNGTSLYQSETFENCAYALLPCQGATWRNYVYKTDASGGTITQVADCSSISAHIYRICINPNDYTEAYFVIDTKLYKSTNSGASFSVKYTLAASCREMSISRDGNTIMCFTTAGVVYISSDGGTSFSTFVDLTDEMSATAVFYALALD